jgi:hypothetical protein
VIVGQIAIILLLASLLVRFVLRRGLPQVGGKLGPIRPLEATATIPDGFSHVYARTMTIFAARTEAPSFSTLKAFLRHGTVGHPALMRIYRVAGCKTGIEIPVERPDYERIDAAEALALLRELPDPRMIRRLQLSDVPCFLDPWVRKIRGRTIYLLGNATTSRLVVLYRPDRRQPEIVGLTLLHEWLHIVGFGSPRDLRRFSRANAAESLPAAAIEPINFGVRKTPLHEAWCELGEKLFGYDDTIARQAALALPVHAMIVWRRVERYLRRVPARFRSTRFAELEARARFMHHDVAPKARRVMGTRGLWSRILRFYK